LTSAHPNNIRRLRRPAAADNALRRLRADWPAELRVKGSRIPCSIVDISSTGASLRIEYVPEGDIPVWLVVDKMPPIAAESAWRKRHQLGIRFLEPQAWVRELTDSRFDPAAWIRD
jgi:hypothetical protein